MQANSATAFSASSAYTVNGDLDLDGNSNSIGSLSGSGGSAFISNSGASAAVLTTGTNGTTIYAGRLQDDISTLGLTVAGTGTLVLTGNSNTYTGATTINSGATLQLGNNTADGNLQGTTLVTDNGTLAFNLNTTHGFNNNINGSGGVTDAGTGTIILAPSSNNTYSGPTVINSGATLQAGNPTAFATGATLSAF
ncbi:MAG TPA: autotransporter-associated beta strand repeat-containing protein, partial [Rhizomicrobium sp.]|nr:autotransporter-associated beta strand repeat-containing protein [Rhizomicrobium sp.]